jgi:GEVED domain/CARDB/Domain of unknown function DUF11/Secretion system C-terminal sorting domain/HYR domain
MIMNNSFLPKNKKRRPLSIKRLLGLILGFSLLSSTLFAQRDLTVSLTSVRQGPGSFSDYSNWYSPIDYVVNFKTTERLPPVNSSDPAYFFSYTVYLSTDSIVSADDLLIQRGYSDSVQLQLSRGLSSVLERTNGIYYYGIVIPYQTNPNGRYYVYVKADSNNDYAETNENNNISNVVGFDLYGLFCQSKGTTPWNNWIQNVSVGSLNNASDKGNDRGVYSPGYSNFANLSPTNFNKGQSYPFTITPGVGYVGQPNGGLFFRVWIDANGDGIYTDNEQVLEKTSANIAVNQTITIPATAKSGVTGMRVSVKAGSYPFSCEVFDLGEVEDYLVNLTGANVAPDLTVTNVIAPSFVRVNEALNLSYRVKNIGTAAGGRTANNFMTSVGIFSNPNNGNSFGLGFTEKVTDYPVGFDSLVTLSRVISPNIPVGNYILKIEVDPSLSITESNETNNIISIPLEVRAATTENLKLIVTNVTGNNRVDPNGVLSVNVTVKNNATVPSLPDSVSIVSWLASSGLGPGFFYSAPYSTNKVAIPAIAANQSVTIPATFTMPATLSSNVYAKPSGAAALLEPYFITKTVATYTSNQPPTTTPQNFSYNYPILPAATADLALTGSSINATWDSINRFINVRLRVTNNGPNAANNITVAINRVNARGNTPELPSVVDFTQTGGGGSVERKDIVTSANDNSAQFWGWKIPTLAAGASIEATFKGTVRTEFAAPQTITSFYKDLTIKPTILYADALDNVKTNDTISGGLTYRFVRTTPNNCTNDITPPVFANCPVNQVQNVQSFGGCTPFTWTVPTATDLCSTPTLTAVSKVGATISIQTNGLAYIQLCPFAPFGIDVDTITYTARDAKGNTSKCQFELKTNNTCITNQTDQGSLPNNQTLTTTGTCAHFKWAVPTRFAPCARPNQYLPWGLPTTTPTVIIGRDQSSIGSGIVLDSACFPLGTTIVTYNDIFSNVRTFNVTVSSATATNYCVSKGNLPWTEWIAGVQFSNINNPSQKEGYGNFTNLTANVTQGQAYTFTLTRGFSWAADPANATQVCSIWIDYNQNKIFEASEMVLSLPRAFSFANIPIPANAPVGITRMRVALKTIGMPTACETFDRGEVEDYTINISATVTGNQPDLTLQNLTIPTPSVQQGQILNFKVDAKNIGTAAATGNFTIKSYLSANEVLDPNDYADGIVPTGNYAAGFSVAQIPAAMTVRNTLAAGQYYLILKIDADNQVAESNENNNVIVAAGLITVTAPTTGGGGSDIALSITATPSVYRAYTNNTFRISAVNSGTTAFTNVKIKFTKPANTVAGGTKVASIGTFQDYCPGGIECSEWTIPTLAGGATATLDAPIFILAPTGAITATAALLNSTPTDANAANNTATVTLNQAIAPAVAPLVIYKPTQLIPVVIQKVNPTVTESEITVEMESLIEKTVEFGISNSMGQVVLSQQVPIEKGMNKATFDVSALPQGLYFIQTNVGKGRNVPTKFIKM